MEIQEKDEHESGTAEAMNAEILATVSHELRSPLTSIIGYTATLLRQERRISREERQEFLLAIREAGNRLETIINRFLEVSQLETGSISIERIPVDASRIAQEALLSMEQRANERFPGSFTFHLRHKHIPGRSPQPEPLVMADPRLLRQVLDNLLDNAVNYSPEGGSIDIVLLPVQYPIAQLQSEQGKMAEGEQGSPNGESEIREKEETRQMLDIVVCDHGTGIPDEHLKRIFERFHRVDTSLTRTVNGLGLGLTICKSIVELHEGNIWAESCSAGGSAFHVQLPLAEKNAEIEPGQLL